MIQKEFRPSWEHESSLSFISSMLLVDAYWIAKRDSYSLTKLALEKRSKLDWSFNRCLQLNPTSEFWSSRQALQAGNGWRNSTPVSGAGSSDM